MMKLQVYRADKLARHCLRLPGGHKLRRGRMKKKRLKHVACILLTCPAAVIPPSPLFVF